MPPMTPRLLTTPYQGPTKRSITIAGHQTSISLEPIFWDALIEAAENAAIPLSALVARIDAERIQLTDPPNLASALRTWLMQRAQERARARDSIPAPPSSLSAP